MRQLTGATEYLYDKATRRAAKEYRLKLIAWIVVAAMFSFHGGRLYDYHTGRCIPSNKIDGIIQQHLMRE